MIAVALAVLVHAAPEPAVTHAFAVRGGALMLPLHADASAKAWPHTMGVRWTLASGTSRARGMVVWVDAAPTLERWWGASPAPIRVRPIADVAATPQWRPGMGPHLLVSVPRTATTTMRVGRTDINLLCEDLPPAMPDLRLDPSRALGPAPLVQASAHTPGESPAARWRWEVLCAADGIKAPPLPEHPVDRLVALEGIGRWRVLMHAIAGTDRGAARAIQESLTARISVEHGSLAAWETNAGRLHALFDVITGAPEARAAVIEAWIMAGSPLTAWPVSPLSPHMQLSLTNADTRARVVEVGWAVADEIPIAVQVPARQWAIEPLDRSAAQCVLAMQSGGAKAAWVLPPRTYVPEPPGLSLGALVGALTLHDVQAMHMGAPPPSAHRTVSQVRRLLGRWEVLVECTAVMGTPQAAPQTMTTSLASLIGQEALHVRVSHGGREDTIVVRPDGWHSSSGQDAGVDVHIAPHTDGWVARVVLPLHWTMSPFGLSLARTHQGVHAVETAVMSGGPGEPMPGFITIDPSGWDQGATPTNAHTPSN